MGTHTITYTYNNGFCTAQDVKQVQVVLDETLLQDGFSVQVWDHAGPHPLLWIVSRDNSPVQISIMNSAGQVIQQLDKTVYPGGNFIPLDMERFSKGLYLISVRHTISGKVKSVKLVN